MRWSGEAGERFLAALRESGNVSAAARASGVRAGLFYYRRRRDPDFAGEWNAALAAAEAVWRGAEAAFPGARPWRAKALEEGPSTARCAVPLPRKSGGGKVVRRTSNGRVQVAAVRPGQWTAATERAFFDHLRQSGNVAASARAVGSHVSCVWERYRKWPAFAREWEQALDEASAALEFRLVAIGNDLLPEEGGGAAPADPAFDPEFALRFLKWRHERNSGRARRHGPSEPGIEEAKEAILKRIEAIERHRRRQGEGRE